MAGASPGGERRPRVPDGQPDGKQRRQSATRPPPARPSSSGESAMDGNKAESQLESITYELASRPNPGLFARFFSEKGYQKGRAAQASAPGGLDAIAASPPHGSTWASEADWKARISGLATHEKKSRKSAKLLIAQQALSRLRHWTSGQHHATMAGGSPVRHNLMEDAKSAEEAKTLLRQPSAQYFGEGYPEDVSSSLSSGSGVTKASSSAGDLLLLRAGPANLKHVSRRVQSSTAVAMNMHSVEHPRAAGDFCCPMAGGGAFPEMQSATSSEEAWSGGGKKSRHISSQRSIDGFFKLFGRKK
ncbi:uncharacterized protein LOC144161577 [Haemaphysalis longicornis]